MCGSWQTKVPNGVQGCAGPWQLVFWMNRLKERLGMLCMAVAGPWYREPKRWWLCGGGIMLGMVGCFNEKGCFDGGVIPLQKAG